MPYVTAAKVAVTLLPQDYYNPPGMLNTSFPTIAFGDGSLEYPALGIPLPDMGLLGEFVKEIKRIIITPPPGDGYIYKYDKVNKTIRIYEAGTAGSLTVGANTAGTPTGNVAAPALSLSDPTANLANAAVVANSVYNTQVNVAQPTGNLANTVLAMQAMANHTHAL